MLGSECSAVCFRDVYLGVEGLEMRCIDELMNKWTHACMHTYIHECGDAIALHDSQFFVQAYLST